MTNHLIKIVLNSIAVLALIATIALPLVFAKNFTKVAGVKTEAQFLIISQVDKFPDMILSQTDNDFSIKFNKSATKQAFLSVFIINNPTEQTKKYQIDTKSGNGAVFFGENLKNMQETVTLPPNSSSAISVYSDSNLQNETSSFSISIR